MTPGGGGAPDLRRRAGPVPEAGVNLPHAGGAFPGLIGRLDHGTKVRPELKHMQRLPSEYLRRFTYDTIGHDDRINMNLIRLVGATA